MNTRSIFGWYLRNFTWAQFMPKSMCLKCNFISDVLQFICVLDDIHVLAKKFGQWCMPKKKVLLFSSFFYCCHWVCIGLDFRYRKGSKHVVVVTWINHCLHQVWSLFIPLWIVFCCFAEVFAGFWTWNWISRNRNIEANYYYFRMLFEVIPPPPPPVPPPSPSPPPHLSPSDRTS